MYKDRLDAAKNLLPLLQKYKGDPDAIVVAIPRGALVIGGFLATNLGLRLDIVATKKIPAPHNPEFAIGAIAPDGEVMLDKRLVSTGAVTGVDEEYLLKTKQRLIKEIKKRYSIYKGGARRKSPKLPFPTFMGETVILVDDGIATGFTVKSAIAYLRRDQVGKIVVATPVASKAAAEEIESLCDEFICPNQSEYFSAVAQFYDYFAEISDREAIAYLKSNLQAE